MGSLAQAKTLGGIGSILGILIIVPRVGFVFGIVGFILVLIAIKYISDAVGDKSIFNNWLIAVILAIVGLAVGAVALFVGVFSLFDLPNLIQGKLDPSTFTDPTFFFKVVRMLLLPLALTWLFLVVSAVFRRRSLNSIASSLNIGLFSTAAILYLIGSALTIVLVGFIIVFVADIIQVIAFFSITEQTSQSQQPIGSAPR